MIFFIIFTLAPNAQINWDGDFHQAYIDQQCVCVDINDDGDFDDEEDVIINLVPQIEPGEQERIVDNTTEVRIVKGQFGWVIYDGIERYFKYKEN